MKREKPADDIGARIKALRLAKGIRRGDVAREADISYDYITKIENGHRSPNIAMLGRILVPLETTVEEFFASGDITPPAAHGPPFPLEDWDLVRLASAKPVPLVGWTQAGEWTPAQQEPADGEAVWSDSVPDGCFALRVEGDSMEPEFSPGALIIVDPNAQPKPGDFVVARIEGEAKATFKQYRPKGGKVVLHALNPAYPDIKLDGPFDTVLVGVVVESKRILTKPDSRAVTMAKIISRLTEMTEEELDELAKG